MGVVTTVHSLKGNIQDALDYVLDESKTEQCITECSNCASPLLAGKKWKSMYPQEIKDDEIVGYHFLQSYDDENISPEKCFELAKEWIQKCTNNEYDYTIAVHKNTGHVHAHIIVNPFNKKTGKKWDIYYKRDLKKFRTYSDEICQKYGLEVFDEKENRGINNSWYKHHHIKQGDSNDQIIIKTLDYLCDRVENYDQLKLYLQNIGYEVEDGLNNQDLLDYENYNFTLHKKMIDEYLSDEYSYFVRIPYTQEYIQIPRENAEWNQSNKILKCHLNFKKEFVVYDCNGNVVDDKKNGVFIANHLENKNNKGRSGLRIKTPLTKKFRRCKFLKNEDHPENEYSLESIIKRIENNNVHTLSEEIEKVLYLQDNSGKETKQLRNLFYENANIKTKYNQSEFYHMNKYNKFLYVKSNQIQENIDHMVRSNEILSDVNQLSELKKIRREIGKNLSTLNKQLYLLEKQYIELQGQMFEGIIDITEDELEEWIGKNIEPLRQEKFKLKKQASQMDKRIKIAEKNIEFSK